MNRFFLAFASTLTSGLLSFSYLKEWMLIRFWNRKPLMPLSDDLLHPYFHQSQDLYLRVTFVFGALFFLLFFATLWFFVQREDKKVFLCFVLTMITLFAVMVNASIK